MFQNAFLTYEQNKVQDEQNRDNQTHEDENKLEDDKKERLQPISCEIKKGIAKIKIGITK